MIREVAKIRKHPFPLLKSLCFFTLSSPSERADVGQLEHRSSQLRPLTMKDDKPRWEELTSHRANLGPGAPLTRDLRGGCRFKPHLCSGSKSEHPNSLTFISWAEAADFCMHQPRASCIMHLTWTGDSFHI